MAQSVLILIATITLMFGSVAQARIIELRVLPNGNYKFGSEREIKVAALQARIRKLMRERPRPDVQVMPDRLTKFDRVVYLLATFQKMGYGPHFGFTGIEKPN
jgi:biopolymer transport protein ExbD